MPPFRRGAGHRRPAGNSPSFEKCLRCGPSIQRCALIATGAKWSRASRPCGAWRLRGWTSPGDAVEKQSPGSSTDRQPDHGSPGPLALGVPRGPQPPGAPVHPPSRPQVKPVSRLSWERWEQPGGRRENRSKPRAQENRRGEAGGASAPHPPRPPPSPRTPRAPEGPRGAAPGGESLLGGEKPLLGASARTFSINCFQLTVGAWGGRAGRGSAVVGRR